MGLAWPSSLALKLKPIPSTKSTRGRPQHHLFPLFSGGGASGLHLNRSESGPQVNHILSGSPMQNRFFADDSEEMTKKKVNIFT